MKRDNKYKQMHMNDLKTDQCNNLFQCNKTNDQNSALLDIILLKNQYNILILLFDRFHKYGSQK